MVARSRDDKGFLSRWSERKRDARQTPEETAPAESTATLDPGKPLDSSSDASAAATEETPFDIEDLPDIDSLEEGADFSVFMHEKVPTRVSAERAVEAVIGGIQEWHREGSICPDRRVWILFRVASSGPHGYESSDWREDPDPSLELGQVQAQFLSEVLGLAVSQKSPTDC